MNEKQDCRVWVGHIPDGIRPVDLREKFEKFGKLSDIKFVRRGRDEHYAFLQFEEVEEAKEAISRMDNSDVFGGKIEVRPANPTQKSEEEREKARNRNIDRRNDDRRDYRDDRRRSPSRERRRSPSPPRRDRESNSGKYRVEVSNLPRDMTWQELKRLASDYGKSVIFTRTQRDHRENTVNGIVEFSDKRDAENLISSLDGKRMEGGEKRLALKFEQNNDDVIARPSNRRRRSVSRSPPRRRSRSRSHGRNRDRY